MAERRMFTKKVTDDDNFMGLSSSAQALYLHLSMSADDDGFSNQVSISMFKAHASVQDLQALLEKRYIYQFDNGVIVIKHWRMANALRKDRYTPTAFQEELRKLDIKGNGAYTWLPDGCQMGANRLPQDSIDKVSIDKDSIGESAQPAEPAPSPRTKKFVKPTLEEVTEYVRQGGYQVDPERFHAYYESCGWTVKGRSMKDWKAAVRYWATSGTDRNRTGTRPEPQPAQQAQRKGSYFVPHGREMSYAEYEAAARPAEDDDDDDAAFEAMLKGGTT